MTISLKTQNRPLLIIYSLAVGAALWWIVEPFSLTALAVLDKLYQSAVFIGVATIVTLLVGELIPARLKLLLVYWKFRNPTPGSYAFTELMHKDYRIDPMALETKYGPFPTDPSQQDRKFYSIYKPLDGDLSIDDAHKSFLLFRELSVLSSVFIVFGSLVAFLSSGSLFSALTFGGISTALYFACAISAQNAGRRFVVNVLAVASVRKGDPAS